VQAAFQSNLSTSRAAAVVPECSTAVVPKLGGSQQDKVFPVGQAIDQAHLASAISCAAITEMTLAYITQKMMNLGLYLRHSAVVRRLAVLGNINNGQQSFEAESTTSLNVGWQRDNLRGGFCAGTRHSSRSRCRSVGTVQELELVHSPVCDGLVQVIDQRYGVLIGALS